MGGFSNSLFRGMIGWIRSVFSEIWSTSESGDSISLLEWVSQHWITLVLFLCLIGLAADLAVYFFRWKPHLVWRSFFKRKEKTRETETQTERWNDSNHHSAVFQNPAEDERQENHHSIQQYTEADNGESKKSPETDHADYRTVQEPIHNDEKRSGVESVSLTERYIREIRPQRRRISVNYLFGDREEDEISQPPDTIISREEAYHKPIYPRGWRQSPEDKND